MPANSSRRFSAQSRVLSRAIEFTTLRLNSVGDDIARLCHLIAPVQPFHSLFSG
jgi:hypothetical protein